MTGNVGYTLHFISHHRVEPGLIKVSNKCVSYVHTTAMTLLGHAAKKVKTSETTDRYFNLRKTTCQNTRRLVQAMCSTNMGFERRCGQEISLVSKTSLWGPSLIFNGYRGVCPGVSRPERGVSYSLSSSGEVKNDCPL